MDFGSIRRKNKVSQPSSRRKTLSSSNLSCMSYNSASVATKILSVTVPKDFGCDVNLEGKIVHMRNGGPAHALGIVQLGDYIRIVEDDDDQNQMDGDNNLVKLQVTFGVLLVDVRPNYPLVIEIGNRSHTSLGLALADSSENKIRISSIQPGSLADRCGFLQTGDIVTSIYINNDQTAEETSIPCCSPFYNSYQIAQILRQLTCKQSSIKLTIVPCHPNQILQQVQCHMLPPPTINNSTEDIDIHSGGSDSTLTLGESDSSNSITNNHQQNGGGSGNNIMTSTFCGKTFRNMHSPSSLLLLLPRRQIEKVDEQEEEQGGYCDGGGSGCCVLSLSLWKDPLYEDWGFSLVDETDVECDAGDTDSEVDNTSAHHQVINSRTKLLRKNIQAQNNQDGAIVGDIRPGGPAYIAGLRAGDKIMEINRQDVSKLESTMLVPLLASLEDALNLVILRDPNIITGDE